MKKIPLTQNKVALVDDADFDWLNQWKWHARKCGPKGKHFYAVRREGNRHIFMHKVICPTERPLRTDHRNRNTLDNQRHNLRPATFAQNIWNKASGPLRGIRKRHNSRGYQIRVAANGVRKHIAEASTLEEAVRIRDLAVRGLHGEFAVLS